MVVLIVLGVSWMLARMAGRMAVPALDGWRRALPYALAAMFLFTWIVLLSSTPARRSTALTCAMMTCGVCPSTSGSVT